MKLTIEVFFEDGNGLEMERRLNRAIAHYGEVLKQKGMSEIELTGEEYENEEFTQLYRIDVSKS